MNELREKATREVEAMFADVLKSVHDAVGRTLNQHRQGLIEQVLNDLQSELAHGESGANQNPTIRHKRLRGLKRFKTGNGYVGKLLSSEVVRFKKALRKAGGDRTLAAQLLGISRATFFRHAKDLGLVKTRRKKNLDSPSVTTGEG